jgi:uncharacterized membrane protein YidH (DUF202 family)
MAGAPETDQGGLARERTVLAWNRSGLAVIVCIAVLVRHVWPLSGTGEYVAMALIAATAVVWSVVLLIFSTADRRGNADMLLGPRVFGLMTAGTLMLAALGFFLAFYIPT